MQISKSVAKRIPSPYVLALLLTLAPEALANFYAWVGTTTNYNTPTNWNPAGVPGGADTAIFDFGAFNTNPTISGGSDAVDTLSILAPGYTLTIQNPGSLALEGAGISGPFGLNVINNDILSFTNTATSETSPILNSSLLIFSDNSSAGFSQINNV